MHYWWERDGVRFECTACGRCCGGEPGSIWVTPAERARIAGELGIDEIALRKEYLTRREGRCSIKEMENYDCIFLNETRGAVRFTKYARSNAAYSPSGPQY